MNQQDRINQLVERVIFVSIGFIVALEVILILVLENT